MHTIYHSHTQVIGHRFMKKDGVGGVGLMELLPYLDR